MRSSALLLFAAALFATLLLTGCGATKKQTYDSAFMLKFKKVHLTLAEQIVQIRYFLNTFPDDKRLETAFGAELRQLVRRERRHDGKKPPS
jgi:hypothetical protein